MTDNKLLAASDYSFDKQYQLLSSSARGLKKATIGIIAYDFESYFTSNVLKGISQVAHDEGYQVIITNSQGSPEKEMANARLLLQHHAEGVIVMPCSSGNKFHHFKTFKIQGIPVVMFDQLQDFGQSDIIVTDHRGCGYMATEHLVKQGCKLISIVTNACNKSVNSQYSKGYCDALKKYNISCAPVIQLPNAPYGDGGKIIAGFIQQMSPRPDGLFFTNDIEAASCMQALQEAGICIPGDIAIASCGNTPVSRLVSPALTTIDYPAYETGKAAADALLNRLNSRRIILQQKITVMPANLIVRNSSKKMPQAVI